MSGKDNQAPVNEEEILAALAGSHTGASVDPTQFRRSDAGNADLLVAMFGHDLRYVEKWASWRVWNGKLWVEASDLMLISFARAATEQMFRWAETLPKDPKAALRKHALASQKRERLVAMIGLAKGDPKVRAEPRLFDADHMVLGCDLVTFDLRSRKAYLPRRQDFITKSTGITPVEGAECPNWLAYLEWAFGADAATIEHLQRIAGYILTGDVSEEKLFCFFGGGGNGKSTVAMTLYKMMGDYSGIARTTLLMERQGERGAASPDVAALHGKRLVITSETDEQCSLAEAQAKSITSNEPIAARSLNRDPFVFMPTHKTILMTNHRPFVKGTDDGIWRRLNIIGFNQKVTEDQKVEKFREEMLYPELPGILAWAIRGCFKLQRDGLKPSPTVKAATNAYRSDMDFMAQWIEERTVPDPQATVARSAAYENYKDWALSEGAPKLGNRRFVQELDTRGFDTAKSHGVRLFKGLKLKQGLGLQLIRGTVAV